MKAYLTSIGERTTEIAKQQLQRFGFHVEVLGGEEAWLAKYRHFIELAAAKNEDCMRIDADVIVNKCIMHVLMMPQIKNDWLMVQCQGYDFYRNNTGIISPVFYKASALKIIKSEFSKLDPKRPEASAWRLKQINPHTYTSPLIIGMHGFFQDHKHLKRHLEHKEQRRQLEEYDFDLALKLLDL